MRHSGRRRGTGGRENEIENEQMKINQVRIPHSPRLPLPFCPICFVYLTPRPFAATCPTLIPSPLFGWFSLPFLFSAFPWFCLQHPHPSISEFSQTVASPVTPLRSANVDSDFLIRKWSSPTLSLSLSLSLGLFLPS